jgi:hypothetical protein
LAKMPPGVLQAQPSSCAPYPAEPEVRRSRFKVQRSILDVQSSTFSSPFSLVPEPIRHTIRGGGAAHLLFRAMPAITAALVRRRKRMRICLQARSTR